jgi:hypothetical protein
MHPYNEEEVLIFLDNSASILTPNILQSGKSAMVFAGNLDVL